VAVVKFVGANGYLQYRRVAAEDAPAPVPQTLDGARDAGATALCIRSPGC